MQLIIYAKQEFKTPMLHINSVVYTCIAFFSLIQLSQGLKFIMAAHLIEKFQLK